MVSELDNGVQIGAGCKAMSYYRLLWSHIVDSSLWDYDPMTRLVFMSMLAISERDGTVKGTLSSLARRLNLPLEVVTKAVEELCAPDPNDSSGVGKGERLTVVPRGWHIVNFDEHQRTAKAERRRQQKRDSYHRVKSSSDNRPSEKTFGQQDQDQDQDQDQNSETPSESCRTSSDDISQVLQHLNEKADASFRVGAQGNRQLVAARLKEGATVEQMKAVIDAKVRDWWRDPKMRGYLRPATLFNRTKYEQYVGQLAESDSSSEWVNELFGGK